MFMEKNKSNIESVKSDKQNHEYSLFLYSTEEVMISLDEFLTSKKILKINILISIEKLRINSLK